MLVATEQYRATQTPATTAPQAILPFLRTAEKLKKAGQLAEAERECRKGLAQSTTLLASRFLLAEICYLANKPEEARTLLVNILAERPDHGGALKLMCKLLLLTLEDKSRAFDVAQTGLLFYPGDQLLQKICMQAHPKRAEKEAYLKRMELLLTQIQKRKQQVSDRS